MTTHPRGSGADPRKVILVEGRSDYHALDALAERYGRDLNVERTSIVAMGGATNIGAHLDTYWSADRDVQLAGLCDAAEVGHFQRGIEDALRRPCRSLADMEGLDFYVCVEDLEDELIRALGVGRVRQVIAAQGESRPFHTFQRQPEQRDRPAVDQLRRFMGTRSGRKVRYARALVEALDLDRVPRPLRRVLGEPPVP